MSRREQSTLTGLVLALGVVAAVAAHGRVWSSAVADSRSGTRVLGLALVAGIGLIWLALIVRATRALRGVPLPSLTLTGGLVAAALLAALVLVVLLYAGVNHDRRGGPSPILTCLHGPNCFYGPGARVTGGAKPDTAAPRSGHRVQQVWIWAAGGVAAAFLGAAGLVALRRRRSADAVADEDDEAVRAVSALVEESLDDLRSERDARRAVIACYARMERMLSRLGLPREPFEAPFEYLERVLVRLRATTRSARRLTHLFEEAKFSEHVVNDRMRNEAIDTLSSLQRELRTAQ